MAKIRRTKNLGETHKVAQEFHAWLAGTEQGTKGKAQAHPTEQSFGRGAIVVALRGDLGAGKTAFTQGLAKAMGIESTVTSPTFVLMKKYSVPSYVIGHKSYVNNLVHIDAYRLTKAEDLIPLKFEEYVNDPANIVVVEWPEMVDGAIPPHAHVIDFKFIDDDTREITLPY